MLQRMANRAQNLKVFQRIVVPISVFMMHAQYFWLCIVTAPLAFCQHLPRLHSFTHCAKSRRPSFFFGFVNTNPRAKLSLARRRSPKFLATMLAHIFDRPFARHAFVVARGTAILSLVRTTGYVRKFTAALLAICFVLNARSQRLTRPTAKNSRVFSVIGHGKNCATVRTTFFNSFVRSHHAAR